MLVRSYEDSPRFARALVAVRLRPWMQALLLLLFTAVPAQSQTVIGRVFGDSPTEPIAGAVVTLIDGGGQRVKATLSNEEGRFFISAPAAGSYRLRAEMIGRKTTESETFAV